MTKFKGKILIVALIVMAFTVSAVSAQISTWEVNQIESGPDDLYISDTGNKFSFTPWVQVKSKSYSLTSYFAFRGVDIPASATILNATLEFTAPPPVTFAPNATLDVTIYGLKTGDLTSWDPTPDLESQPFTTAFTNFDTTPLSFGAKINVTVTDQVKEIYDMHSWVSGNDMGFRVLSVLNPSILSDRYQVGYEYNPNDALKLYIEYAEANDTAIYYKGFLITSAGGDFDDFTEYTLVDSQGFVSSLTSSNIIFDGFPEGLRGNRDERLYRTLDNSVGNFSITFDLNITNIDWVAGPLLNRSSMMLFIANSTVGDTTDIDVSGDMIEFVLIGHTNLPYPFKFYIHTRNGGVHEDSNVTSFISDDPTVLYYYEFVKDGKELWLRSYSDSLRTVLVKQVYLSMTNEVSIGGAGHKFYVYNNRGETGNVPLSFNMSNLSTGLGGFLVFDENGTQISTPCISAATSIEDVQACIDEIVGQTPDDPNPPGTAWPDDGFGVLTRFNLRFVLFALGWFLIIVPLMIMAVKSWPLKIYLIFLICMMLGLALQWSIGSI